MLHMYAIYRWNFSISLVAIVLYSAKSIVIADVFTITLLYLGVFIQQ